eukprot:738211-Hanusia_phi.AAC.5
MPPPPPPPSIACRLACECLGPRGADDLGSRRAARGDGMHRNSPSSPPPDFQVSNTSLSGTRTSHIGGAIVGGQLPEIAERGGGRRGLELRRRVGDQAPAPVGMGLTVGHGGEREQEKRPGRGGGQVEEG